MGKLGINKYIEECHKNKCLNNNIKISNFVKTFPIEYIKNKVLAIDLYQLLYKFLHNEKKHYLTSLVSYINYLKKYSIYLIFVIDGKPPSQKKKVLKKRKDKKVKSQNIINKQKEELIKLEEQIENETSTQQKEILLQQKNETIISIKKHTKRTIKITKECISNIKIILDFLEIPYLHILNKEADYICAQLVKKNIADACLSNDYDMIAYQCPLIIRNLNITDNTIEMVYLKNIKYLLELSRAQITQLIILNGNDYKSKYHQYDYNFIHNLIKKEENFVNILKLLNFGNNEYNTILDIYTQKISKNNLIDSIKNFNNIKIYERCINDTALNNFTNNLIDTFSLKNKDVYQLKTMITQFLSLSYSDI